MTMITPSYLGETIEYSSLHACRSTLEDPNILRGPTMGTRGNLYVLSKTPPPIEGVWEHELQPA